MQKKEFIIKAKDDAYITAVIHDAGKKPAKGIVIVITGFGEHSGSYEELIEHLISANYVSVIFDQRGHGNLSEQSPEKREKLQGIIPDYQSFLDDIGAIAAEMKQTIPNTPVVLYGHSMGGNIVINYLLKHDQSGFSCAIVESPWLGLYKEVNPMVKGIARVLGSISPKIAIVNKLSFDDITGDKVKAEEIRNDPLYHNRISLRMFAGINRGCKYAVNNASRLFIPTYFAFAKHDRIVSNQATQKFCGACGANVIVKEYESCHAIHNDVNREQYYQDIIAFLDKNCSEKVLL